MSDKMNSTGDDPIESEAGEEPMAEVEAAREGIGGEVDAVTSNMGDPMPTEGQAPTLEEVEEAVADQEMGSDLDRLQVEFAELNDRHLRLAAEYSNFRRRAEGERVTSWDRAQSDLLRHMLEALDDLQRVGGWEAEATTVESLVEGVDLVERKFVQALEAAGVEVIDPVGEPFDPNLMEGMMRVATESLEQDEFVEAVYQKGYSLNGQLVRPARVSVFKHG